MGRTIKNKVKRFCSAKKFTYTSEKLKRWQVLCKKWGVKMSEIITRKEFLLVVNQILKEPLERNSSGNRCWVREERNVRRTGRVACLGVSWSETESVLNICESVSVMLSWSQGALERTRGGDSLGIACGHQIFTCNKKKGEGVEGRKGEEKKGGG